MEDAVRPSNEAFRAIYERGYRTWATLWEMAGHDTLLLSTCPVFPNHPYFPGNLLVDKSFSNAATVKGNTNWTTTRGPCDLPPFNQEVVMQVAWSHATILVFLTDSSLAARFANCSGTEDDHLPVLLLAWSYILSARWAELIPGAEAPKYNTCQAPVMHGARGSIRPEGDDCSAVVNVGDVDADAVRWWSAVLSPDSGWSAFIPNDKSVPLYSPWSVKLPSASIFTIHAASQPHSTQVSHRPASFNSAMEYMLQYCHLHGINETEQAALAAALLIPVAKFEGRTINLHFPRLPRKAATQNQPGAQPLPLHGGESRQLDRLITLSCNPRELRALLTSVFFEPTVDCNICGAWLQGSFACLDSEKVSDQRRLLCTITRRDPDLGFLWLGAFLTGANTRCLQDARIGWWKVDLNTAAWTGTHVSFIQNPVLKANLDALDILRSDECRLMYLSHHPDHMIPPLFPFGPFGFTATEDTTLDVRQHVRCAAAHGLKYEGFAWDCQEGNIVEQGVDDSLSQIIRFKAGQPLGLNDEIVVDYDSMDLEDETSEMVTRNVFTWLREEDGFPVAERVIREHEWIDNLESDEECSINGDVRSTAGEHLGRWLLGVSTKRSNSL